jgi:predicted O-methyltransferase YrrM
VSNEGPVSDYVRRARRVAEQAGRTAAAPVVAARRQRQELAESRTALQEVRDRLARATAQIDELRERLGSAEADRDQRPLPEQLESVIRQVRREELTDLPAPVLRDLALAARDLEANRMPGLVVEAGNAVGGSAIVLAAAKAADRPMKVYDGSSDHRSDELVVSFARLGLAADERHVDLVAGRFEDTIELNDLVALVHLDADSHTSTLTVLERLAPLLVSGGRIVLNDYDTSPGAREAVDEYFRDRHMDFRFEQHNRQHVVRR